MRTPEQELNDSSRFVIQRRLGAGGFGVVYEAYDRRRDATVAIKVLNHAAGTALYRFKREFRTLTGLTHRNLVELHELISEGSQWWLTMELIRGVDLLDYIRDTLPGHGLDDSDPVLAAAPWDEPDATRSGPTEPAIAWSRSAGPLPLDDDGANVETTPPPAPTTVSLDRTREVLRQLTEGIIYLHSQGVLHRDVKPSNVLVDRDGRVVILDFGLARPVESGERTDSVNLAGTPAYMAPELVSRADPSEASDWYSVGVILYAALTGRLPFEGASLDVLQAKSRRDPTPADQLIPGLPTDLVGLCGDLLERTPTARPTGAEILERLGGTPARTTSASATTVTGARPFVGRQRQLAQLQEAYDRVRRGGTVVAHVQGSSGMGKTALVRHFLHRLSDADPNVVVFAGRCYEQEAVPYKALDEIIDGLTHYLKRLSRAQTSSLLPRNMWALERVFPVLARVDAVRARSRRRTDEPDVHELRRRASTALREMLGRLTERRPLVLFIDDLQWGDVDSASLLADLLRPPDQPALLLVACYRREEVETSPTVRRMLSITPATSAINGMELIDVPELTGLEADELARRLLGDDDTTARGTAIARESGGSPFFLDQLVEHGRGGGPDTSLHALLAARAASLDEPSRRLLEATAVAGRPLELTVAREAAQLAPGDADGLDELRRARLIRIRATDEEPLLEIYHDRIRASLVEALSDTERRRYHARLADAFQHASHRDPEQLAVHYREAGEPRQAVDFMLAAADGAAIALAFSRAARLYRSVLDLLPPTDDRRHGVWATLGTALANAGQVIESAEAYLTAADGADATERPELHRLAAEQFLLGGHIDQGLELLTSILAAVGIRLPSTPRRALVSMLLWRPVVRARGLRYRERSPGQIPVDELRRIDLSYSVSRCLGFTDPIRAMETQTRHLRLALRAGEPYRVARALSFEAIALARGVRTRRRARTLLQAARDANQRSGAGDATAIIEQASGMLAFLEGRWTEALSRLRRAELAFRTQRGGSLPYNIVVCQLYGLHSLFYLGRFDEFARWIPECLAESLDRGDLYAEANLRLHQATLTCFVDDDPDTARADLERAMARWSRHGYHMEHAVRLFRAGDFALYAGDAAGAWRVVDAEWPRLSRSLLRRVDMVSIVATFLRGRAAVALAATLRPEDGERRRLLRMAARTARALVRRREGWGIPLGQLVEAGVARTGGDASLAAERLAQAELRFDALDMGLHAAAARWRRGQITGGGTGEALIDAARDRMGGLGISVHDRIVRMLIPGV